MNKLIVNSALAASLAVSAAATAGHAWKDPGRAGNTYVDRAPVVSVRPIVETIEVPVTETVCREVPARYRSERPRRDKRDELIGTVAGAVFGGLIGNRIGEGRGNELATMTGAVIGAAVGNKAVRADYREQPLAQRGHRGGHREKHCETLTRYETRDDVVGYKVKYRYHGRVHKIVTDRDPGEFIDLRVRYKPIRF